MERLFNDPVPVAAQVINTPFVVFAVLLFSLAAVYMALWWAARDYQVFRNMGIYLALCGVQMIWLYEGGGKSNWALIAITGPVLVMIAGEALHIPNRRWTLIIWPFSILVVLVGWLRGFHFLQPLPVDASDLILLVLIVQWVLVGQRRDRNIAAAFFCFLYPCTRDTFFQLQGSYRYAGSAGHWGLALGFGTHRHLSAGRWQRWLFIHET